MLKISSLGISLILLPQFLSCGRKVNNPSGFDGGTGQVAVSILSEPPGADIFINNVATGMQTPLDTVISEGDHTVLLALCDYEDWTKSFHTVDGDTLQITAALDLKFAFLDDFISGAGNWTAGCPFSFSDFDSYNGSSYVTIAANSDCSTQLLDRFEIPSCLEPVVSFYYKLKTTGFISANLKIDAVGGPHFEQLDTTSTWTRVNVPSSAFTDLSGEATFSFVFSPAGNNIFRFSLDDFSLNAQ